MPHPWPSTRLASLALLIGACGQAPMPAAGPPPATLTDAPLLPAPCATVLCAWNDLGLQPLNAAASFIGGVSMHAAQGRPMLAWDEIGSGQPGGFQNEVFVRVNSGASWEAATRLNDFGAALSPALAQTSAPTLPALVAFAERLGNDAVIRVKVRSVVNGASVWSPLGGNVGGLSGISLPGSSAGHPSAVVTPDRTFVAWDEYDPATQQREIFVWMYRNGVWHNLGTRPDGSVDTGSGPKLAVNPNNRMALTYFQDSPLGGRAVVRRWGGSSFDPVPDPSALGVDLAALGIASSGEPVVAVSEFDGAQHRLVVRQRTGHGTWRPLGPALNFRAGESAFTPSLVVAGDQISVAWSESRAGNRSVYMKRWDPLHQLWAFFGEAVDSGIVMQSPALTLNAAGNPLVAATEARTFADRAELRVREWGPATSVPPF